MINLTLNVSDIQHFSTGDGEGIRTTVFLKGCNLYCPWCHNPETQSAKQQTLTFKESNKTVCYGKSLTVDEILKEILEDIDFYTESKGGVTISGGEAMLYPKEVKALLLEVKKHGINVIIDTAGDVPYSHFNEVNELVDCYFFDVKSGDKDKYKEVIGGNLDRIKENLSNLIKDGKSVRIRIPVIPNFNDSEEEIEKITLLLQGFGVKEVDLLPFHRLGSSKYKAMDKEYKYASVKPFTKEQIEKIANLYRKNFTVKIEK